MALYLLLFFVGTNSLGVPRNIGNKNGVKFDKMFKIKANDPNAVYQFLTLQRKLAIYNAQQAMMKTAALQITDTMVEAEIHGTDMKAEEIIFVMRQLIAVARQVSSLPPQS